MFWIKMFEENLVQSVEGDLMNLDEDTPPEKLEALEKEFSTEPQEPARDTFIKSNSS